MRNFLANVILPGAMFTALMVAGAPLLAVLFIAMYSLASIITSDQWKDTSTEKVLLVIAVCAWVYLLAMAALGWAVP